MGTNEQLSDALVALGFSHYEAKSYVGLLTGGYGQTAYALWKRTGVPQPKIYEALRRLVDRGVAVQVGSRPQRFSPRPVDEVLAQLRTDFDSRVGTAERTAADALQGQGTDQSYAAVLRGSQGKEAILRDAAQLVSDASERLYISAWADDLDGLRAAIEDASRRGVAAVVLVFGRASFELDAGSVYRHASTAHVLYRSHRSRHIGVIADGRRGLWGVGYESDEWSGLQFDDRRLVSLLRQFIRHDIYVQRINDELRPELESAFGLGLERLIDLDRITAEVTSADSERESRAG